MISTNLKHINSPSHSSIPLLTSLASKSSQSISSNYSNKRSLNGSVSQERLETPKKSTHAKKSPLKKTLSQELSSFINRDHSCEQKDSESPSKSSNNKKPSSNSTPSKDLKTTNKLAFAKNENLNEKPFKRTIINKKLPTRLYTKSKHHTIDVVNTEADKPAEVNQPVKQGGIPRLIKSNSSFEKPTNEQKALNKSDASLKESEIKQPVMTSTPNKHTNDLYNQMPNKKREIFLYKDDNLGYGFIAGSEKPLVVRFVTPGKLILAFFLNIEF